MCASRCRVFPEKTLALCKSRKPAPCTALAVMYKGGMLALLLVLAWSALTSSSAEQGVQALDQRKLLASKVRQFTRACTRRPIPAR